MLDILTNDLFLVLLGIGFSAGFVPWLTRRWQERDRELHVRTSLVAEMSQCIMSLDVELKARARAAMASTSDLNVESLASTTRRFDITRCAIGTKLEVYFPKFSGLSISDQWTKLGDLMLVFSVLPPAGPDESDTDTFKRFVQDINDLPLTPDLRQAAIDEAGRHHDINHQWSEYEQLLLTEKLRLIAAVSKEWMPSLKTNSRAQSIRTGYVSKPD